MKKAGTIIRTAALTFAVGGALIFGSAMVIAQTSATGIETEGPAAPAAVEQAGGESPDAPSGGEQASGDATDGEQANTPAGQAADEDTAASSAGEQTGGDPEGVPTMEELEAAIMEGADGITPSAIAIAEGKDGDAEATKLYSFIKKLPNGATVIVNYSNGPEGARATVTYGDGSVYAYRFDAAEAAVERFGGPKRDLPDRYVEGRPGDGDLTEDSAVSAALKAIKSKYALTEETLDRFSVTPIFYSTYEDIEGAVWYVRLYPKNVDEFTELGAYWTALDPATGEALQIFSADDGKG